LAKESSFDTISTDKQVAIDGGQESTNSVEIKMMLSVGR